MNEKIRAVCGECDKKLACPPAAAGRKVRCPGCGAAIQVPTVDAAVARPGNPSPKKRRPKSSANNPGKRRKSAAPDNFDDPYQSTVPGSSAGLPPRAKKRKSASRRMSGTSNSGDRHWTRKISVGFGIMGASLASNAVQMAVMGRPDVSTAEGKGRAFGQGLVTVAGLIFGLVVVVRGFLANRTRN